MAGYLLASDIPAGSLGTATAVIDGKVENMFYIKSLTATVTKNKNEIRVLGTNMTQHKTTGAAGTGSATIYYVTSKFVQLMQQYQNTGKDVYFDITITNTDNTTTIGSQTVTLHRVNLDSTVVAKFDVDNTELDEDIGFTFESFTLGESFTTPTI
jgi:hypothetical protein